MLSVQDLVDQWMFPLDSKTTGGAVEKLQCCLNLLQAKVTLICSSFILSQHSAKDFYTMKIKGFKAQKGRGLAK